MSGGPQQPDQRPPLTRRETLVAGAGLAAGVLLGGLWGVNIGYDLGNDHTSQEAAQDLLLAKRTTFLDSIFQALPGDVTTSIRVVPYKFALKAGTSLHLFPSKEMKFHPPTGDVANNGVKLTADLKLENPVLFYTNITDTDSGKLIESNPFLLVQTPEQGAMYMALSKARTALPPLSAHYLADLSRPVLLEKYRLKEGNTGDFLGFEATASFDPDTPDPQFSYRDSQGLHPLQNEIGTYTYNANSIPLSRPL